MKPLTCLVASAVVVLALASTAWPAGHDRPAVLAQATPEVCTEIYQPVCGTNADGQRVTYSNACFARAAKATQVTPGKCAT